VPAIWGQLLSADERAALRPGLPDDLDRRPDVLVVGGGAIGLAAGAACVRGGLGRVVVLEREPRLAAGASGSNAGAIAPDMHLLTDSAEFVAFGRASRTLYRELDADWGGAIGLWPARWLNIFPPGESPLATRQAPDTPAAGRTPPEHMLLDAAEVKTLEPDVRLPDGGSATLVDGQYGVNPQRLAAALAGHAGQVATGVAMRDVTIRGDRVATVHTTAGDFTPGALIVATGLVPPPWDRTAPPPWDRTAPPPWDRTAPQRWVKGHMLAVGPGRWRLGSVLAGPLGGGTPLPGGQVVCGGTFDLDDHTAEVRPEVSDRLATDLAAVLPAAAGASVTDRWYCFRPYIEGRQPVVDRLPGLVNGWFAGGHFTTGIMMAAATGAAVASWIADSARPASVRGFTLP
jgi:glycine/D-amino acid oxidase-like deaminating enzyme